MKYCILIVFMLLLSGCYTNINGTKHVFLDNTNEEVLLANIVKAKSKEMDYNTIRYMKIVLKAQAAKFYYNDDYTIKDFEEVLNKATIMGNTENKDLKEFKEYILNHIKNNKIFKAYYLNILAEIL